MTEITALTKTNPATHVPRSLGSRIAVLAAIVVPFFGLIASVVCLWGWGLSWVELMLLGSMYLLTGLGITVGYHRLFAHHSFETSSVVQCILGIIGGMAVQGPLLAWVAVHRRHHQHSDCQDDPHSPHHQGKGFLGLLRGLWHSHIGWMFKGGPNLSAYVKDLNRSALIRTVSRLFPLWAFLGLLIPTALGFVLSGGWIGALLGLIWGGLVRIFLVHHVTWSVNSICHWWGRRTYPCRDESRNNALVGILSLGEGFHNNHHAFPTSARHGLRWWQIDLSYYVIWTLALMRLAWNVKSPGKGAAMA